MKKSIIAGNIALILTLSVTACSDTTDSNSNTNDIQNVASVKNSVQDAELQILLKNAPFLLTIAYVGDIIYNNLIE